VKKSGLPRQDVIDWLNFNQAWDYFRNEGGKEKLPPYPVMAGLGHSRHALDPKSPLYRENIADEINAFIGGITRFIREEGTWGTSGLAFLQATAGSRDRFPSGVVDDLAGALRERIEQDPAFSSVLTDFRKSAGDAPPLAFESELAPPPKPH